ncbi:MAG TPA: BON domain-containing protein [Pyrinomonadaceae bacterium]|nr:BON domain-containing protein [Pyrinomonadaceae bacterium]
MKKIRHSFFALALALSASAVLAADAKAQGQRVDRAQIEKKVRRELVTLPYYGVFDNLAYEVNGGTVTLYGQVVRPSTRSDAERRVGRLAGVARVVNRIEVLPLSGFDDSIRARTYRALFGMDSPLFRYGRGTNPSIHIVVNRGHVTLEGVVANEGDSRLAYIRARGVPGVFSVTNNLDVERRRGR